MSDFGVFTAPGAVRIQRLLPGPIERVWAYLAESDKRRRWLAAGDMQFEAGARVELVFRNSELTENDDPPPEQYAELAGEVVMIGRVTQCDPQRLLAYTWGGETPGEGSEVRFELTPHGDKVLLVVTHDGFKKLDDIAMVAGGWHTHLDILAARLDGREPEGFWRTHTRLKAEYEKRLQA